MPEDNHGNQSDTGHGRSGASGIAVTGIAATALCAGMVAVGGWMGGPGLVFAAAGGLGLVVVALVVPVGLMMARRRDGVESELRQQVWQLAKAIDRLSEQAGLSADARRVINRRGERELLRHAIEEDIAAEDWDAAMVLVKELAERFGYRADAEEFRQRIEQARFETVERRVGEATARLDALIVERRWDQALVDAARIVRLYPDSPRVEGLRHRVEQARGSYKADLERRFLDAADEQRIDEAMELLKEMDSYLTMGEAEPYRELARGVIGKARENLGVRFKLAVQDGRWTEAAAAGERIVDEFPNSRMALEVRSLLDGIRMRAAGSPARAAS